MKKFEVYLESFNKNDPETWESGRLLIETTDRKIIEKYFPSNIIEEVETELSGVLLHE